jgi:hypothetical protein
LTGDTKYSRDKLVCNAYSARCRVRHAPAAGKLARSIERWVSRGQYNPQRIGGQYPLAYSVTLTSRCWPSAASLRAKLGALIRVVARRAPKLALLGSVDRSRDTGRWHVHVLVLAPPTFDITKLVKWWRRLWPRKAAGGAYLRPSTKGQKVRRLAAPGPYGATSALTNDLVRVLTHNLGRTREVNGQRVPIPGLPAIYRRVVAYGALARVWERVCGRWGIPLACSYAPPYKARSRAKKVSTKPLRPSRTWSAGESCVWCGKALAIGTRKDARHCGRACGSAASRALCTFEKRMGAHASPARARVVALENDGWLRRDAIKAVAVAVDTAAKKGKPLVSVKIKQAMCRCGQPLAAHGGARTCGHGACRSKEYRRRRREERKRARVMLLFRRLLRVSRWAPFTAGEVHALGADLRVRERDVIKLLSELVEDGAAFNVVGLAEHYAFVPPRARRVAA